MMESKAEAISLKKVLLPVHLWAIAVGLVISGEYFGWNYGWAVSGTVGFLIATLIVTILYVTFVFSFTELTSAIPHAGGAFAYAFHAMGPVAGFIAGFASLIEFLFSAPAIAFALGSYLHFLFPSFSVLLTAFAAYVVFILINLLGIKESALFSLVVTLLAVGELLLYLGLVAPHFKSEEFLLDPLPFGIQGIFAALPFAIWFYLAIEGVALVSEEVKDPQKNIPKGYLYSLFTLILLALAVMILTGGITHWKKLSSIDYPLPEALRIVLGKNNPWTKLFASIGLFGLIASFHGTVIGYSRQIFGLARSGYLPVQLAQVNKRFQTPHFALLAGGLVGSLALLTQTTDQVIILSVMGALTMYIMSMISLFVLRVKRPDMERPFVAPLYPFFPGIALLLSLTSFAAIVYFNFKLSLIFLSTMFISLLFFLFFSKRSENI